jgi:hypothetical protein
MENQVLYQGADKGAKTPGPAAAAAPVKRPEKASFSLSLWRVNEHLLVVDSRRKGEALPTHKLLDNILRGMNLSDVPLPRDEVLYWPMVDQGQDQSWEAAEQMVNGFLEARLMDHPLAHMLLFGEAAFRAIVGQQQKFSELCFRQLPQPLHEAEVRILPSLGDILLQPALKRDVWLCLLPLVDTSG